MAVFRHAFRNWSAIHVRWTSLICLTLCGLLVYGGFGWNSEAGFREFCEDAVVVQSSTILRRNAQEQQEREDQENEKRRQKYLKADRETFQERLKWTRVISDVHLPSEGPLRRAVTGTAATHAVTSKKAQFWSFQPLNRPTPPQVQSTTWLRNPIDRFIAAQLEQVGLEPNPEAERQVLCRRLWYGLVGHAPPPEEVMGYAADESAMAYERLVSRLLSNPGFGEHSARMWLDLARYADSNGYEEDELRPHAYPYRDFVIWAMNQDLPFDRFIRWQIAGDLIEPDNPLAVAATGFFTAAPYNTFFPQEAERFTELDDMVSTMTSSMLGLSVGCARCHDHKHDPIPTRDYYGLIAVFFNTRRTHSYLIPDGGQDYRILADPVNKRLEEVKQIRTAWIKENNIQELEGFTEEEKDLLRQPIDPDNMEQERLISLCERCLLIMDDQIDDEIEALPQDETRFAQLLDEIEGLEAKLPPRPPMGLTLSGGDATQAPILIGGDLRHRDGEVESGFVTAVTSGVPVWENGAWEAWDESDAEGSASVPRRALARWMTDTQRGPGPLLARVIVNRLWQQHFGQGLVRTTNDFGQQGELPSHPLLLEWLACELMDNNWSLKHIHRLIVTSATYRLNAGAHPNSLRIDPENRFLSRRRPQRITAEMMWDTLHLAGGNLPVVMYGPGIQPPICREAVFNTQKEAEETWPIRTDEDRPTLWRRGIYVMLKRTIPVPIMQLFDAPVGSFSCGKRKITTVPTQALALWHSELLRRQARRMAERTVAEVDTITVAEMDIRKFIERVYVIAFSRKPDREELVAGVEFLREIEDADNAVQKIQKLADFCHVMFLTNEFLYVD